MNYGTLKINGVYGLPNPEPRLTPEYMFEMNAIGL